MTDAAANRIPEHVAIIMDGNGRWAKRRGRPRVFGHRAGQESAEAVIRAAREKGVKYLTLFAFSSENWKRPEEEVSHLMGLLASALEKQVARLAEGGIRLRFIGDLSRFSDKLVAAMRRAEEDTAGHDEMLLNVAVGYGGRWDIVQAARQLVRESADGRLSPEDVTEDMLAGHLSLAGVPDPDLLIRTGGECRISNFLLWNLAYTEIHFTDVLWPDFDAECLDEAIQWFSQRDRRFGCVGQAETEGAGSA